MSDIKEFNNLKNEKLQNFNIDKEAIQNNNNIEKNNLKKQISNIKVRDNRWDNFKGILIFLVVYAHFLWEYYEKYKYSKVYNIVTFIYIFHMPGFIFCSGFFSQSQNSKSKQSISKLLILYIIFDSSLMLYYYYYYTEMPNIFNPKNSYWYLLTLILWRMIIPFFDDENFLIIKSFIIGLIIGYNNHFSIDLFSFKRTFAFLPFFVLGYKIKKEHFNRIIKITNILIVKIICIIVFCSYSFNLYENIRKRKINFTGNMLLMGKYKYQNEIFKRIEVFKLSLIMIILLLLALPNTKIPIITMIGRNSLYIYLFHRVFTLLFTKHYGLKVNLLQIMKKSLIGTIIIVIVFGNDYITKYLNLFIDFIYINMSLNTKKGRFIKLIFFLLFILIILSKPLHENYYGMLKKKKKKKRKKK